jgi:hypothetical protein
MNSSKSGEIMEFLALMRRQALGKYVPLWPAPKRLALKCFGGTMDIDEFRSFGGRVEPPQIYWPFEKIYTPVEKTSKVYNQPVSFTGNDGGKLKAIDSASTPSESLKLKRTKPLARTTSKLESALGIKRTVKECK